MEIMLHPFISRKISKKNENSMETFRTINVIQLTVLQTTLQRTLNYEPPLPDL